MIDKNILAQKMPKHAWISAPIVAFAGVALGILFGEVIGIWGCLISSFIIFGIAVLKPRHDLVSLLVPLFAIIIFNPWSEFDTGLLLQVLFAGTITVVAIRLEKRYSE